MKESLDELEFLKAKESRKDREFAKLALQYIDLKKIQILDVSKQKDLYITDISKDNKVDDMLVSLADKFVIATLDKELRKRIKGKFIYLRSNHLEIGGK